MNNIIIREAKDEDFDSIWQIFHAVVKSGDTYIYPANTTKEEAYNIWTNNSKVYVAMQNNEIVGHFRIHPNKIGYGSHICNAGYMVSPNHRSKGIGRQMALYSLKEAKKLGYRAMQFNIVVSTNEVAVKLWQSVGFKIVGTIEEGFNHQKLGFVDSYIMYQKL